MKRLNNILTPQSTPMLQIGDTVTYDMPASIFNARYSPKDAVMVQDFAGVEMYIVSIHEREDRISYTCYPTCYGNLIRNDQIFQRTITIPEQYFNLVHTRKERFVIHHDHPHFKVPHRFITGDVVKLKSPQQCVLSVRHLNLDKFNRLYCVSDLSNHKHGIQAQNDLFNVTEVVSLKHNLYKIEGLTTKLNYVVSGFWLLHHYE